MINLDTQVVRVSKNGTQSINIGKGVPAAIGHYCHLVKMPSGVIQLSGQKAWDPETGELIDADVSGQTRLIMDNIRGILTGLNLDFDALTRLTCFLSSVDDYAPFNEAYTDCMGEYMPARTVVAGLDLRGGALIEIAADAYEGTI